MSGEFYDLLSQKGQASVRQIDYVYIKESQGVLKQIWCFDMKPIDPIKEEEDEDDELQGLTIEDKQPRKVGQFIKHEDFNEDMMKLEEGQEDPYKDLTDLERVFEMDHDFRCI